MRLGIVGFILVLLGSLGAPRGRRVHSGSRRFTWAGLGVVIRVCVGSLVPTKWSSSSIEITWDHLGATRGRRVHSGSCGFTLERLGVVGFIRVSGDSFRLA